MLGTGSSVSTPSTYLLASAGRFQWQEPSRSHCLPTFLVLSPICRLLKYSCLAFLVLYICPPNIFVSAEFWGFLGPMESPWLRGEQSHTSHRRDWGSPVWQAKEKVMGPVFRGTLTEKARVGDVRGGTWGSHSRPPGNSEAGMAAW